MDDRIRGVELDWVDSPSCSREGVVNHDAYQSETGRVNVPYT